MKIEGIGAQVRSERAGATARSGESQPASRTDGPGGDRVEVSAAARRMAVLFEAVDRLPEIREERVEELRQALRDGYEVEPRRLARAILEFEDGLYR